MFGVQTSEPISQSADAASWWFLYCLTSEPEGVRHRLVHRTRLPEVLESGLGLGHAVPELVADHVERAGHHAEHLAVAVAEHHALAVPEGVGVLLAEVDHAAERHARVVDRVAAVCLEPEVEGVAEAVVGLVGRDVARRRIALASDDGPANVLGPLGVADHPGGPRGGDANERVGSLGRDRHAGERVLYSRQTDRMVLAQSARGPFALLLVALARDVLENDRRQYAVKAVTAAMHASLLAVGGLCRPYACPNCATTAPSPLHPLYPTKPRARTARTNPANPGTAVQVPVHDPSSLQFPSSSQQKLRTPCSFPPQRYALHVHACDSRAYAPTMPRRCF